MKTKITALALLAASALSLAPKPAVASDKGLAIVGGFLGGLIVASAINDSYHDSCAPARTTVVVDDRCDDRPSGYWREASVRVWVPGCWIVERDYRGCDRRRYSEGHYESRNNRTWVAYERHGRYNNDRRDNHDRGHDHDREVSSGYGRRR
jgi:hypothetical protein